MAYSDMLEEIEFRTKAGDDPMEVLRELREPYIEQERDGIFKRFFEWISGGEEEESEEIEGQSVVRKKIIKPQKQYTKIIENDEGVRMGLDPETNTWQKIK